MSRFIAVIAYIGCFAASLYLLSGFDFARFLRRGQGYKGQAILILLSLGTGYLAAQFLLRIAGLE